jgi:hypothetical protein
LKKLFLLVSILTILSSTFPVSAYEFKQSLEIELSRGNPDIDIKDGTSYYNKNVVIINSLIDHNMELTSDTLGLFYTGSVTSHWSLDDSYTLYNKNTDSEYDGVDYFIRRLYVKKQLGRNTVGFGVVPFSFNGAETQQFDDIKRGEGLTSLINLDLTAMFYIYSGDSFVFKIGDGNYDFLTDIPKGKYFPESKLNNKIAFLIVKNKDDNFNVEFNSYYAREYYYEHSISESLISGLMLSYSNLISQDVFMTFGYSVTHNHNLGAKTDILADYSVNNMATIMFPENFAFDESEYYYGTSLLLGYKYSFDFFNRDSFLKFEFFKTWDDWYSLNYGTPYRNMANTGYLTRDNSLKVELGYSPKDGHNIFASYSVVNLDEFSKLGNSASTIPYDESILSGVYKLQILMLGYNIKF